MKTDLIELNRCRSAEGVADTTDPLDAANIWYKVGSTAIIFDYTKIGGGDDPEVIVSVRKEDYDAARAVLENEYGKVDLPDGHYLLSSSDEDLAEILANPGEWNPFDVVHARRLAEERGLNPVEIEKKKQERIQQLKQGKPASKILLSFGWIFSIIGLYAGMFGIAGIVAAWALCFSKNRTEDGNFYTYNSKSRMQGICMFLIAIIFIAIASSMINP
jgi:hypothetical protein